MKRSAELDSLLGGVKPASPTFEVTLASGKVVLFNRPRSYTHYRDLITKCGEWIEEIRLANAESWRDMLAEADDDVLQKVYELWKFIQTPALTSLDLLTLAMEEGLIFLDMYGQFYTEINPTGRAAADKAVTGSKKGSSPISDGGTPSPSAETSGESTPTS